MAPSDLLSLIVTAPSYQAPLALMIGLVGLAYGGNLLVPATLSLAKQLHISPALVAVIVLAGGTSMPELLVSVQAAFQDSPAIALGNVVGSNLANSWLVLGIARTRIEKYEDAIKAFRKAGDDDDVAKDAFRWIRSIERRLAEKRRAEEEAAAQADG